MVARVAHGGTWSHGWHAQNEVMGVVGRGVPRLPSAGRAGTRCSVNNDRGLVHHALRLELRDVPPVPPTCHAVARPLSPLAKGVVNSGSLPNGRHEVHPAWNTNTYLFRTRKTKYSESIFRRSAEVD